MLCSAFAIASSFQKKNRGDGSPFFSSFDKKTQTNTMTDRRRRPHFVSIVFFFLCGVRIYGRWRSNLRFAFDTNKKTKKNSSSILAAGLLLIRLLKKKKKINEVHDKLSGMDGNGTNKGWKRGRGGGMGDAPKKIVHQNSVYFCFLSFIHYEIYRFVIDRKSRYARVRTTIGRPRHPHHNGRSVGSATYMREDAEAIAHPYGSFYAKKRKGNIWIERLAYFFFLSGTRMKKKRYGWVDGTLKIKKQDRRCRTNKRWKDRGGGEKEGGAGGKERT